ncbi:MAG: DNA translocase FtsK 4TM domain-containing protein [Beijerinckiaceae bacterium]|nr:DNA translocase FtsK 4TM domain-containing protein [Beijerinckiaceae bacterium]MCZ8300514.1 DNA translocase FtsK 4TM domain-containing protein [Beijerinckiaceae bacterium]
MRTTRLAPSSLDVLSHDMREGLSRRLVDLTGLFLLTIAILLGLALASWSVADPSLSNATTVKARNWLGFPGAVAADLAMQLFGIGSVGLSATLGLIGSRLLWTRETAGLHWRLLIAILGLMSSSIFAAALPTTERWPLPSGLGGALGDVLLGLTAFLGMGSQGFGRLIAGLAFGALTILAFSLLSRGLVREQEEAEEHEDDRESDEPSAAILSIGAILHGFYMVRGFLARLGPLWTRGRARFEARRSAPPAARTPVEPAMAPVAPRRIEPGFGQTAAPPFDPVAHFDEDEDEDMAPLEPRSMPAARQNPLPADVLPDLPDSPGRVTAPVGSLKAGKREIREAQVSIFDQMEFQFPPLSLLAEPKRNATPQISTDALEQNARLLEGVLDDFGVRGEIINVRPGPVVTLYELEPAPGTKSSRVIGLAEDIARSMSAVAARVAVVPGRNAIGIELPNAKRETVLLRELLASEDFEKSKLRLPICLGKTIGGEPVIVDLARMPHLLVAGTTGSGKSVAINTMICSLLYRLKPEECRLIMIDPKMLELSIYDGIPHLLSPVVTDPKKAVVALKWAVREMEERYRKMSKIGVRNIDGFNARMEEARERGECLTRTIQTGYDRETGEALYEEEIMELEKLPYIVVIVDEMADLMLVAGKEIEGAVQRLAQMARAAGIHIVMATQRPSVDVITGTIKANFPTRISFQVTSKIDSRTILGEMGAEQLLGQGDMLYMAGGGRISRVHGPFVADQEVEKVVSHLKTQGRPDYVDAVTTDLDDEGGAAEGGGDSPVFDKGDFGDESADLYDQAVAVVLRDKKASTSYVQRRLQIGYNRAASIIERMEREGIVGPANHAGKREILLESGRED